MPKLTKKPTQGGVTVKKKDPKPPGVDRRTEVSDFFTKVYSDPRVVEAVERYFFPNETIRDVSDFFGEFSPTIGDFIQSFQSSGTRGGEKWGHGFKGANEEILGSDMSNVVDRYNMYMKLNRNPLIASSTGGDITQTPKSKDYNRGWTQSISPSEQYGTEKKPLTMGLGAQQMMGQQNFMVADRGNPQQERSTTVHEMSHATDKGQVLMPQGQIDLITSLQEPNWMQSTYDGKNAVVPSVVTPGFFPGKTFDRTKNEEKYATYVAKPTETKARLMSLRYIADNNGLDYVDLTVGQLRELADSLYESGKKYSSIAKKEETYLQADKLLDVLDELNYSYTDESIDSLLENIW